jgi:hypothetical protein
MPTDSTISRDHVRLHEQQRAERNASNALLNLSRPTLSRPPFSRPTPAFDGPSDTRTRPRHHFRRGAISEASGRPYLPIVLPLAPGEQASSRQELRIRSSTINDIEIEIVPSSRQQQPANNPINRTELRQWRELADQIGRGLVNLNNLTPSIQERINEAASSLHNLRGTNHNRPTMEGSSRPGHRDTYRYGREGWWTVENQTAANQRPATIPGSSFAVPHSTLNLFQSVDLFAQPPPEPTALEVGILVGVRLDSYWQPLATLFHETVAALRRGCDVPRGRLFILSMELSRITQLRTIVDRELLNIPRHERGASRRGTSLHSNLTYSQELLEQEDRTVEEATPMAPDDDSSVSETDEPEGWRELDIVLDDDYPREVYFHIGSHEFTYPIEEVEGWMLDEQRRERRTTRTEQRSIPPSYLERQHEIHRSRSERPQILHTLTMPRPIRSIWLTNAIREYDHYEDEAEDDAYYVEEQDGDYDDDDDDYTNGSEGDTPDREYEEEDEGDPTEEDLDHEGWGDPLPQDSQAAEQSNTSDGSDAQSQSADVPAPVIDLTGSPPSTGPNVYAYQFDRPGSPSPAESQPRSQNTSDESTPATVSSSTQEDVLMIQDVPELHRHPIHHWISDHAIFMFSCRGSIFEVTRQLQQAFNFTPPISPHMVGERLNGACAAQHRRFVSTFLPGEEGIYMRASRRLSLHQHDSANDDVYHGTQDIVDADSTSGDYVSPPLPASAPPYWDRRMDVLLLRELNRGRYEAMTFWLHHPREIGYSVSGFSREMQCFLRIRLAQVRYLTITDEELEMVW